MNNSHCQEIANITNCCNPRVTKGYSRVTVYPSAYDPIYKRFLSVRTYICNPVTRHTHSRAREQFSRFQKNSLYRWTYTQKVGYRVTALILKGNSGLQSNYLGYSVDSKGKSTLKGGENRENPGYNVDSKGLSRKVLCIKQIGPSVRIQRYCTAAEGFDLDLLFQNITRPSGDPCGPNRDGKGR
jgi:hypothetical protein